MKLLPQTLMVAIQCVAAESKAIDRRLKSDEPKNAAELEQLLVSFDLAADDLKVAYEEVLSQYAGLPPYDELLK